MHCPPPACPCPPHTYTNTHSGWWGLCAFNKQKAVHGGPVFIWSLRRASSMCSQNGWFSYKGRSREELCRHMSLPWKQNHFWSIVVTTSIPKKFLLTFSVVGLSFEPEVKARIFIFGVIINLPRHFKGRQTCCPRAWTLGWHSGLLFPVSEDSSSLHKPRLQAQQPLFQVVAPTRYNLEEFTYEGFFPHILLFEYLIMLKCGHLMTIPQKHWLCIK